MGASTVYGVGGAHGGWSDLVKLALHKEMYSDKRGAEAHEVHIFAKPDATMQFVANTYERYVADYRRDNLKTIVMLSVGMNDAKAVDRPDNFMNSPQVYQESMTDLLNGLTKICDGVLCVGFASVDESMTSPKVNPFTGKNSYFTNSRIAMFNEAFRQAAADCSGSAVFVDVMTKLSSDWTRTCLSPDGLHPNDAGYQKMLDIIWPELKQLLAD